MNSDIVFEILKCLHLCPEENGGALLAEKVVLSEKSFGELRERKMEKPIVFSVEGNLHSLRSATDASATIYWGDGDICRGSNQSYLSKQYSETSSQSQHVVRIFGPDKGIQLPDTTKEVHSIGDLTDLGGMLHHCLILEQKIGQKWDTSKVKCMSSLFSECRRLNYPVGRNWNTSEVTNMESMFADCVMLDSVVGKNWDTSKVVYMSCMFSCCKNLDKKIGTKWDVSKVTSMGHMFSGCKKLRRNIGKSWNLNSLEEMLCMFYGCRFLSRKVGKNWQLPEETQTTFVFWECDEQRRLLKNLRS